MERNMYIVEGDGQPYGSNLHPGVPGTTDHFAWYIKPQRPTFSALLALIVTTFVSLSSSLQIFSLMAADPTLD